MASAFKPHCRTYKKSNGATIKAFSFVKLDTSSSSKNPTVTACGAGDAVYGIAQNDADVSVDGTEIEVALPGGGALLKAGGTVALGNSLKSDANGAGIATTTAGDHVGAMAVEGGVSGDVIGVHVTRFEKYNADAT